MKFHFVAPLILILLPTALTAEPLWQNYDKGALETEVLSAFPKAEFEKGRANSNHRNFRMDDYPSVGMWMYFKFDQGLDEVVIHGRGIANFMSVTEGLTKKYGQPLRTSQIGETSTTIWMNGGTSITATFDPQLDVGGGMIIQQPFRITYQASTLAGVEKGL